MPGRLLLTVEDGTTDVALEVPVALDIYEDDTAEVYRRGEVTGGVTLDGFALEEGSSYTIGFLEAGLGPLEDVAWSLQVLVFDGGSSEPLFEVTLD